jgi:hypothetical protein
MLTRVDMSKYEKIWVYNVIISRYWYKIWVQKADDVIHYNACKNSSNDKSIDGSRQQTQ